MGPSTAHIPKRPLLPHDKWYEEIGKFYLVTGPEPEYIPHNLVLSYLKAMMYALTRHG